MADEDRIAKTSEIEKIAAQKSYAIEVEKWKIEVQAAKRKKVYGCSCGIFLLCFRDG